MRNRLFRYEEALQKVWHVAERFDKAPFYPISSTKHLLRCEIVGRRYLCRAAPISFFFFCPWVKPSQMTCSSCSSSRRSPHLYPLKENTCGILMGLRIELYEMSIIARDREIHSSALQVQPTSRWICHLRHLGMFLMVCCQVAWKNPACPVSVVFFCSPSL